MTSYFLINSRRKSCASDYSERNFVSNSRLEILLEQPSICAHDDSVSQCRIYSVIKKNHAIRVHAHILRVIRNICDTDFPYAREIVHGNQPLPLSPPRLLPDGFRIQRHFRLFKSTEPILFTRGAKTEGRKEDRRKRGRKREKTNKFAANRPLSKRGMQMAPGAISNFTILKVVGATFSAFHCLPPPSSLLLLSRRYPCGCLPSSLPRPPLSTSRIYPS